MIGVHDNAQNERRVPQTGEDIAAELEARALLPVDLVEHLGMSRQKVSDYICGRRRLTPAMAERFADAIEAARLDHEEQRARVRAFSERHPMLVPVSPSMREAIERYHRTGELPAHLIERA